MLFVRFFCRKIMQGLFNVLETELQSYIHFADRLDNLYVLCMTFFYIMW